MLSPVSAASRLKLIVSSCSGVASNGPDGGLGRDGPWRRAARAVPEKEETLESGEVAASGGRDERIEKADGLGRRRLRRSVTGDMLPGAGHHLASVGLLEAQDPRDVAVGIVEGLAQDVRRLLDRRQL